jgi:hypothetical protein
VRTAKNICFLVTFSFIFMTTFDAKAATVSYTLDNVILLDGQQITGTFDWNFDICDFEDGNGVFTALEIPWAKYSFTDGNLNTDIQTDSIEISGNGNYHDTGLDIKFSLLSPFTPTQPASINLGVDAEGNYFSYFECCGNGFKDQPFSSGSISPIISPFLDMDGDGIRNGLDPSPDCINNNACNDVDDNTAVTFTNQVIDGMLVQCADHDGVNVGVNMGSNVHVMNNGELQVITPVTTFTPGLKVHPGGKLAVFSKDLPN